MDKIKSLTEQHPESVAQLFLMYGYDMEPSPKNLQMFLEVHGNNPLPISNFNDSLKAKPRLFDIVNGGVDLLGNVLRTVNPQKFAPIDPRTLRRNQRLEDGRIVGINRTLFFSLIGLVVLVGVIILLKRK